MFDRMNKNIQHNSVNPQNEQGKYIVDLLKRHTNIREPSLQKSIEDKFKITGSLNLAQLTQPTKSIGNLTSLEEKICIYI